MNCGCSVFREDESLGFPLLDKEDRDTVGIVQCIFRKQRSGDGSKAQVHEVEDSWPVIVMAPDYCLPNMGFSRVCKHWDMVNFKLETRPLAGKVYSCSSNSSRSSAYTNWWDKCWLEQQPGSGSETPPRLGQNNREHTHDQPRNTKIQMW